MYKFYLSRQFFILLFLALATYGQEQKLLAILRTVDDGDPEVEPNELIFLTGRLREIAGGVLQNRYGIMTDESIINKLGKDNAKKACKETEGCLAQLGRKINADYICQARLGRFGGNLTIIVELYNSGSGLQASPSITGQAKDVSGLLAVLEEKTPSMFKKMPGVSGGRIFEDGISGLQGNKGYDGDVEKLYMVNLNTEPLGANLSFDGVPGCPKTPCKAELRDGGVRIMASLEQYEIADTTVSIKQNNQNITIKLKPNFGFLEIKPAFLDDIGKDESWNFTINGRQQPWLEQKLSPNKYKVELSHRCYEDLKFEVGINKGKREIFDMASNITLKKGGLVLSAERNGEPSSEPVFVNGKRVGETPFSGSVPLCAKIEVGSDKKTVDVKLKHNEKVTHKVKMLEEYELLYNRGNDYKDKYDYDKAIEDYTAALKIKPDYYEALINRGNAYYTKGNYNRAVEDLEAALRIAPSKSNIIKTNLELAREKTASKIQPSAASTFKDPRDNKTYKTIKIGNQTWMAENLNYEAKGLFGISKSKCYDNKPANCQKYGRLYNQDVAKTVCPKFWHLPSEKEWHALYSFVGVEINYKSQFAIRSLRAKNGWAVGEYVFDEYVFEDGTDNYGFSALPGGFHDANRGDFQSVGVAGYWWVSYDDGFTIIDIDITDKRNNDLPRDRNCCGNFWISVRCLKD